MRSVLIVFLFSLIVFVSGACFSQVPVNDTINLKEVKVLGKKTLRKDKSITPLQSIDKQQIEIMPAENVGDAIKTFSGAVVKDYGGIGGLKTVMVRSLGAQHTSVYVDGVPLSETSSGQIDLGKIHLENVDNLSLTIGQQSVLCQSARLYSAASVINISHVVPKFDGKTTNIKSAIKIGSFGQINPYVSVQQQLTKNLYLESSVNFLSAKGDYPFKIHLGNDSVIKAYRTNSDLKAFNFDIRTVYQIKPHTKLTANVYYYNSKRNLPGAVIFYNPISDQSLNNKDFFTNISISHEKDSGWQWASNAKFSQGYLRYLDNNFHNIEGFIDNNYLQNEYYVSQAFAYKFPKMFGITFASDFIVNTLSTNLVNYSYPIRYTGLFVVGSQFNYKNLQADAALLLTSNTDKTKDNNESKTKNIFSPTVSAGYIFSSKPTVKARFLYKNIFRMPTFNDLYYTLIGNRLLKPEFATQYNFGIIANLSKKQYISLKADVFYNRIKDKIVAVPTKNLFEWQMQNIGEVSVKGIEAQLQMEDFVEINKIKLSQSVNYTYQKSEDITEGSSSYGHQIPYIPYETFTFSTSVKYQKFTLAWFGIYNGYRYILNENIYQNMLPSWWHNDLTASYLFNVSKIKLNFKFEIKNIFNKQYEVIKNYPMPGRAYYATFSLTY